MITELRQLGKAAVLSIYNARATSFMPAASGSFRLLRELLSCTVQSETVSATSVSAQWVQVHLPTCQAMVSARHRLAMLRTAVDGQLHSAGLSRNALPYTRCPGLVSTSPKQSR